MKRNQRILAIAFLATLGLLSGCFRLDSNLYNPVDTITAYLGDAYPETDDWDVVPDSSFRLADSMVHLFTLGSQAPGETTPTTIHALYLGDESRIATDTVILYCHGNYGHMDVYWQRAKILANLGGKHRFGVLMMDYRGFGLSEGTAT
ncbi:MAG TPA: hypothetical protein VHS96_14985, partial [Bacteroidia bacterium]|nr:hypothetical protein [Bacteroidia bacterium]